MSRINVVQAETATPAQQELFATIRAALGRVPNFLKVFANSPEALRAFLGLHHIANAGSLDPQTRERIALAIAQKNECEYCLSAHSAIGRKAGLSSAEIQVNRAGSSLDDRAAAAVVFARAIADNAGEVSSGELQAVRAAGYSDAELVEIITHVGLNLLTNFIGKASHVDIDFPRVDVKLAA